MTDPDVDECTRCGKIAPGRRRWMFYNQFEWLFGSAIRNEFYCFRCLGIMRVYSIIGMSILGMIIVAILGTWLWLWIKP